MAAAHHHLLLLLRLLALLAVTVAAAGAWRPAAEGKSAVLSLRELDGLGAERPAQNQNGCRYADAKRVAAEMLGNSDAFFMYIMITHY
jgi:hypothetical protein